MAQDHAERCVFSKNKDRWDLLYDFPSVGENLYVGVPSEPADYSSHMRSWIRESEGYNTEHGSCRYSCDRYSQVCIDSRFISVCASPLFCVRCHPIAWFCIPHFREIYYSQQITCLAKCWLL